jgi:hypothetical protein
MMEDRFAMKRDENCEWREMSDSPGAEDAEKDVFFLIF